MAIPGCLRLHVEVIADGKLAGELEVVWHDRQALRLALLTDPALIAKLSVVRVTIRAFKRAKDAIKGVVFLGDEDHVLDILWNLRALCSNREQAIVVEDFLGQAREVSILWCGNDIHHSRHITEAEALIGFRAETFVAAWSASDALLGRDKELFIERSEGELRWIPAGRDVSKDGSLYRVDDRDSIDSRFGDVETRAFTIHYHPGRDDSTQAGELFCRS